MKRILVLSTVIALALGLCIAPVVSAYDNAACGKTPGKRADKKGGIFKELNLTAEQKKLLDENKAGHREAAKGLFEETKKYRDALSQEIEKPAVDMNKINQIQSQLKALQGKMADERLSSILEVKKILTPEQFAKFSSSMKRQKDKGHPSRKGWGRNRGQGPRQGPPEEEMPPEDL